MGAGASSSVFDYKYQKERAELRKALILSFVGDPENQDVLTKIKAVREIIIQHPELCATAAREATNEFEYSPTSLDAANTELDRLFTIYETSTILKSVQCRFGPVACPLGHYTPYFGDPSAHPMPAEKSRSKKKKIICSVCKKVAESGYHCSFCDYNLCVPCSVIYDENGHTLKLWTHPEAQFHCRVCGRQPITGGYHCSSCDDYNICDLCTALPGRKFIQNIILDRMKEYIKYMDDHVTESETALQTSSSHKKKMKTFGYPTTLHLYNFEQSLYQLKEVAVAEVRQTRIMREVIRLRGIISEDKEYSATATRESRRTEHFTAEEITRLNILLDWSERERSLVVRDQHKIACVLGHAAHYHRDRPALYLRRDSSTVPSEQAKGKNVAYCKICDRVAAPEVFHCEFCEYDLCSTCSVIYCTEGHPMQMWTVPEAMDAICSCCHRKNLTMGYHCTVCDVNTCNYCTSREARGDIRKVWIAEMNALLAYMKANKRLSGVAHYYHWRHNNYIVSLGLLADYVRELRTAKEAAERQIIQKPVIDKIKEFRGIITKDVAFSATAVREAARPEHYVFFSMRKAVEEAMRLQEIIQMGQQLQTLIKRQAAGIACPLEHAMSPIDSTTQLQSYPPLPAPVAVLHSVSSLQLQKQARALNSSFTIGGLSIISAEPEQFNHNQLMLLPEVEQADEVSQKTADSAAHHQRSGGSSVTDGSSMILYSKQASDTRDDGVVHNPMIPGLISAAAEAVQGHDISAAVRKSSAVSRADESSIVSGSSDVSDIFSVDAFSSRKGNSAVIQPRCCRICATTCLAAGHFCPMCEYDLCADCSSIYCRQGHVMKIWTYPEAQTLQCDVCKRCPITAGYRCTTCDTDICDRCTTRDVRNTLMIWPMKELKRHLAHLEVVRGESQIAADYLDEQSAIRAAAAQTSSSVNSSHISSSSAAYWGSMSLLCKKLNEVQAIVVHTAEEIRLRKLRLDAKRYGLKGSDL